MGKKTMQKDLKCGYLNGNRRKSFQSDFARMRKDAEINE